MTRTFPTKPLFLLLGLSLAACTSELADGNPAGGEGAIAFQVPQTRAAVTSAADMQAFSVWGGYDEDATNVFNGKDVKNGGGGTVWTYQGTQYWLAGKTYDFYAVYPTTVNATVAPDGTITVSDFDASATGADAVDLMTASVKDMRGDAPQTVAFRFSHELARLSFTVTSEGDAVTLTSAALVGAGYKGTYAGGTWSVPSASTATGPFTAKDVALTTGNLSATLFGGDLLLIPADDLTEKTLEISYQYDGETEAHQASLPLATAQVTAWQKGQAYNYAVNIPQNGVDVNLTVRVKEWVESNHSVQW